MAIIYQCFTDTLMITGFVFGMMLIIEYINVLTSGAWQGWIKDSRWRQYFIASLLGAIPGCLGAFAVTSLYFHRVISFGAVVSAMIATSGDESFVMLSVVPGIALKVFLLIFILGVIIGLLTDLFLESRQIQWAKDGHGLDLHDAEDACLCFPKGRFIEQLKKCTLARGVLTITLLFLVIGQVTGQVGPSDWNWIKITLLFTSGIGLFIVISVPDHFLEEHLWEHVAKKHLPKIFIWTFGAILLTYLLIEHFHLTVWMMENHLVLLVVACVVGLVPQSGPHLIFLTLFTKGIVPFSVLLASSIVQDGHGMLPLLAESRPDFFRIKGVNFFAGLLVGILGYLTGF